MAKRRTARVFEDKTEEEKRHRTHIGKPSKLGDSDAVGGDDYHPPGPSWVPVGPRQHGPGPHPAAVRAMTATWPDSTDKRIERALRSEDDHLSIGRDGFTLYYDRDSLEYHCDG